MNRKKILNLLSAGLFGLILIVGCADSPTVPIPPPDAWYVITPDEDGYAVIVGLPGAAEDGDAAVVHNERSDEYAVEAVEDDGSFTVEILAQAGDTIVLHIMRDGEVSEETEKEVPSE